MELPLVMEVRMKVRTFLGDALNKKTTRKKQFGCLMKTASTLRCSEKQVLLKRMYKFEKCMYNLKNVCINLTNENNNS